MTGFEPRTSLPLYQLATTTAQEHWNVINHIVSNDEDGNDVSFDVSSPNPPPLRVHLAFVEVKDPLIAPAAVAAARVVVAVAVVADNQLKHDTTKWCRNRSHKCDRIVFKFEPYL